MYLHDIYTKFNLKSVFPRSWVSHHLLTDRVTFYRYITIVSGIFNLPVSSSGAANALIHTGLSVSQLPFYAVRLHPAWHQFHH